VLRLTTGWYVRGSNPGRSKSVRARLDRPQGSPRLLYKVYREFPGGEAIVAQVLTTYPVKWRGCEWAGVITPPSICACIGMPWVDIFIGTKFYPGDEIMNYQVSGGTWHIRGRGELHPMLSWENLREETAWET
jgi:hypothetical protein